MRASGRSSLTLSLSLSLSLAVLLTGCKGDPQTPEYWAKALKDGRRADDRVRTLEELRQSPNLKPTFLPMLHAELAAEKKAEVKAELARTIGDLADPSSVQPLADAIEMGPSDSATNRMNREIAAALTRIQDPSAVKPLLRLLKAKDGFVQLEAMRGLGAHKAKEAVEPLISMAMDDSLEALINRRAVQSLGEIGDPRAVPTLLKMMFRRHKTRGDTFYSDSSFSLYQIGAPAKDSVLALLKGEDKELASWARANEIDDAALYAKAAQVSADLYDRRAEPVLLQKLKFQSPDPDMTIRVRMTVAEALGKMRVTSAVSPIAAMADDEHLEARERYSWALARLGGREAIPALTKAAGDGVWDLRDRAMSALSLVGDERETATFDKLRKDERVRTAKECEDYDLLGCDKPDQLAEKHVARIDQHLKRLAAAKECREDDGCWAKKLSDADSAVRERAALELGRTGKPEYAEGLLARVSDPDLDARSAAIQALDWITESNPEAIKAGQKHLAEIDKQVESEKGKTDYMRVNEDLRRLSAKLHRAEKG